jgi:hypothetical protein
VVASAGDDAAINKIDPKAIQTSTDLREIAEQTLLKYVFSISSSKFDSLTVQEQIDAMSAATMAMIEVSYTKPDINHLVKTMKLTWEDSKMMSFANMAVQMFIQNYPLDIDDGIMATELLSYGELTS